MFKMKKVMGVTMAAAMLASLMPVSVYAEGEKVQVTYPTYAVGTHLSAAPEQACIARFEEEYGDVYELVLEELPSDTAYTDKMKTLAATNELPDVIDGKNGLRDLAIKNGQAIDLTPFLEADTNFRDNVIGAEAIAANTSEDGKIYSVVGQAQAIGYFYNKDLFAQAGIEPAATWEDFWANCEKLVEAGITPMALMTGENSWTTNLLLAAMVGGKGEAGVELMNTKYPETYQTPEMIAALEDMQVALQKYTTADALGAAYANAANNFFTENAAMIMNGAWMIADFSNLEKAEEGFADKVGFALYPGNGLIQTYAEGYSICADTPEEQEAAWAWIKTLIGTEAQYDFMTLSGSIPTSSEIEISEEYKAENPLFAANVDAVQQAEYSVATFDVMAYATVVDAFGQYYPELAAGSLDAAGMAAKLDEAAAKAE